MARETITVKCYPSVEAVNKKTQQMSAFAWELIENQNVHDGEYIYQMLTFTRESNRITPRVRALNEEFNLLDELYRKDNYTKMEEIVKNYQNKPYYQNKQEDLEEVVEVQAPNIRDERRVMKPLVGLIAFSVLSILLVIWIISEPNPFAILFEIGSVIATFSFLGVFIYVSKQENGLRGAAAQAAMKNYYDYRQQLIKHRSALESVVKERCEEILQEAKTLTLSY